MKKQKVKRKFSFWPYFKKQKWLIGLDLFLHALEIVVTTFTAIYAAKILTNITTGAYLLSIKQIVVFLAINIAMQIVYYMQNLIELRASLKITNAMRIDIAEQSFKINDSAYTNHNTSEFAQRISADPSSIFGDVINLTNYISVIVECVVMVVYISSLNLFVGLAMLVGAAIDLFLNYVVIKFRKRTLRVEKRYNEKTGSLLVEIIKSSRDIKSLNLESTLKTSLKQKIDDEANYSIDRNTKLHTLRRLRFTIARIIVYSILILGVWFLDLGTITLATFLIIYQNRFEFVSLGNYVGAVGELISSMNLALERINELFENEEYKLEKFGSTELKNIKGLIEFKDVCFSYDEYRQKTEDEIKEEYAQNKKNKIKAKVKRREYVGKKPVLKDMNFKIQPNTTVAFVGVSGSGKSTVLSLISKMYEVDSGEVLIDGTNINSLNKKSLRSAISLVNQFPYIFDMSIKDNLLLAKPNATEKEIKKALKDSALDEFVNTLTDGVNTVVGESGIKLSGGQKQRLAIARAMLKKSPIIIFDESTSSLDNLAQNQVKESIEKIKGKSTIVIVAHRLSTIKNVDKIFFLEHGKIVDEGTFDELFNNNEHFKTIFLAENI